MGDGFRIIDDDEVMLTSKGDLPAADPAAPDQDQAREGRHAITLITNDIERTAVEIAALYKSRWQIELLFRWIKQHLRHPQVPRQQRATPSACRSSQQ